DSFANLKKVLQTIDLEIVRVRRGEMDTFARIQSVLGLIALILLVVGVWQRQRVCALFCLLVRCCRPKERNTPPVRLTTLRVDEPDEAVEKEEAVPSLEQEI
ncbi:hypothetical protein J6590_065178, partial [Homalodisca vitripennis]